jgi:hypothetical protein
VAERANHWDSIYTAIESDALSWLEREPARSLRLIEANGSATSAVIDVGAGASLLVDALLAHDYSDLTLLDVSSRALAEVRHRLG